VTSESIPEYISKHPLHWRISDQLAIGYTDDRTIIHGPELLRDMLFVPLDRQALREQLIELTDKFFGAGKWEYYDTNDENSFADQALRLFGLENPEPHFTGAGDAADFEVGDAVEWTRGESPVPIVTHEHNIKVGEIVRVENTGQTE